MILVSDIFFNVAKVLGTPDPVTVYDCLNRAVNLLRNKASNSNITWDPSLIYCNIQTDPKSYIVTLPYQIEKPIAINLNSTPAFTRGQLFEFTMNGPGSTDPLVGWQWMDQGTKPLQVDLPFSAPVGNPLLFTSDNPLDNTSSGNPIGSVTVAFVVPTLGTTVQVNVTVSTPLTIGQTIFIPGSGTFTVSSIIDSFGNVTLINTGAAVSSSPYDSTNPYDAPVAYDGGVVTQGTLIFPMQGSVLLQCLCQMLDNSEQTIGVVLGVPSPPVQDLLAVNKPLTFGNITLTSNGQKLAVYVPQVTNPKFFRIKISQPGASIRMLGRRRYIKVSNSTDFIPLESSEAIIQMVKAIKYYDEDQYQAAMQCEQTAVTWLGEDNAAKMLYASMANSSQISPILNLNIYNRDSIIVGDIYEDACRAFGSMGQQFIFDRITTVMETLQNMSQWDPQIGYCDLQSFGGPDGRQFYITLPRYVEEVLAINVNGHPTKFENKWFEFHMNGLHQDNFDGKFPFQSGASRPGTWSNRPRNQVEDMGEFVLAFDPLPVNQPFQLVAIARNNMDAGSSLRIYGYDINQLPIYDADGTEGFLVPVGASGSVPAPNPAGAGMVRCTRVFRDPTSGFIDLWSCDSSGNLKQFLSTYWPDETEPKYRRMRLGERPVIGSAGGEPRYPVLRIRYRKRWSKITSLTDPIHLRSRKAIIEAMKAWSLSDNQQAVMAPGQGITMERTALEVAVKYLNDEWRSLHQQEGLAIQVDEDLWPAVMNNFETMI